MAKELNLIIDQHGRDILREPDVLAATMREAGISEREIHSVMLILKCCPAAADQLTGERVTEVEANALLESVVRQTGLSVSAARSTLGKLMRAFGVKPAWDLQLYMTEKLVGKNMKPGAVDEEDVEALVERLETDSENSELISALDVLAREGDARAAYALGMYYSDSFDDKNPSVTYFRLAAQLGYGPANGALADYEMHRKGGGMWKAAHYFNKPTAIAGSEGRKWFPLSEQLLEYRKENGARIHSTLIIQVIVFVLSVLMIGLLGMAPGFWRTIALLMQAGAIVWTLICKFFRPYHSMATPTGLMMASWLILVLAGI